MAGYGEIIGHEQIISYFVKAISSNKVNHAYIIDGPELSGKKLLAEAFAMQLQCEENLDEPCMECSSCKRALTHNHPDIIYVQHEKPNTISVGEIRQFVNSDVSIRPYSGRYKIYIIDEAEKMNVQAQNALLKTIEEPPSYAILLLLTNHTGGILPTILSRCVKLNVRPVQDELIREFLMKRKEIPDYQADLCVAFAQGNVGRAMLLASSQMFQEIKSEVLSLVKRISRLQMYKMAATVRKLTTYKDSIDEILDLLIIWYRDVLYYKATQDTERLIFKQDIYEIKKQSVEFSYRGLENIFVAIQNARVRLQANVNFDLTLENLLMTLKENVE